jgi:hypothetical protein
MDTPAAFWTLSRRFHQDTMMFVENSEAAIADYLVRGLSMPERRELASFLDTELAKPGAEDRLHRFWEQSEADLGFSATSNLVEFHKLIRLRL